MTDSQQRVGAGNDWLNMPLDARSPIEPRPQECLVPLTSEQGYYFREFISIDPQRQRPLSTRMCAIATRISGALNVDLLEASIAALVRRHEALRTTFITDEGITTQLIAPPGEYSLACVDLSTLSISEAEVEAKRLIREFQEQKIDVSVGPTFEARLFKLVDIEHVLVVLADHMISDGMSNVIMDREIWQAYDGASDGVPVSLPAPRVQFGDYAVWCERTKQSRRGQQDHYWRKREIGAVPSVIPVSRTGECAEVPPLAHIGLGSELTSQLREFAMRTEIPLSTVVLMVYATAMSLWCDREDLVIRCPVHGRHGRPELRDVVGFFSAYLSLTIRFDRRQALQCLLAKIQDEMQGAIANRDFERMRELMPECVETELEFHWRSRVLFARGVQRRLPSNRSIIRKPFRSPEVSESPVKFWCIFYEGSSDICATVHYQPRLLSAAAIMQFGDRVRMIARSLIDRPTNALEQTVQVYGCRQYDAS